jgi:hypothetical protein
MEKAPIWITVFDRPKHFRSCVESLAKNPEARDTVLYISSDGPTDALSAVKVAEVREYIKTISGFKKIIAFLPAINTNSEVKTIAYDEVRTNHPRYIHTEDDNFFSPTALNFFNSALDIYEKNEKIIAVSGYMYPGFPAKYYEQVFLQSVACWGVAWWRDKDLDLFFDEVALAKEVLADKNLFKKVTRVLPNTPLMIQAIAAGHLKAGDVTRSIIAIKQNKYSVHPSVSLVRNMGHDGSGEHCGVNNIYGVQKIYDKKIIFNLHKPIDVSPLDAKWIATFLGGRLAQFYGDLVFLKLNASHRISRNLFSMFVKAYDKGIGLVNRIRFYFYR